MKRRDFIKSSAVTGGSLASRRTEHRRKGRAGTEAAEGSFHGAAGPALSPALGPELPDLPPARWIWYPSGRTLANTFVLFRRELNLKAKPRRATGWISADSRYKLEVNGRRVQWGPAPADPRWPEADPVDLTEALDRRPQRHRRHRPLLRSRRRHLAVRQAGLPLPARGRVRPTARSKSSRPIPAGTLTSPAPGGPASTSAGISAPSRRSSTPTSILTAGQTPGSEKVRTGCRPWSSTAPPTSPPSPRPIRNTRRNMPRDPPRPRSGRGASR